MFGRMKQPDAPKKESQADYLERTRPDRCKAIAEKLGYGYYQTSDGFLDSIDQLYVAALDERQTWNRRCEWRLAFADRLIEAYPYLRNGYRKATHPSADEGAHDE